MMCLQVRKREKRGEKREKRKEIRDKRKERGENQRVMKTKKELAVKIFILAMAVGFIFYGAYRGEANTVFSKAIRLCLECVGIG